MTQPDILDDPRERKYLILFGAYVGFWGVLPAITVKLVNLDLTWLGLGLMAFSFGSFAHACTFPCTDAVAEVWGPRRARMLVYLGVLVYVVSTAVCYLGTLLPPADGWQHNDAYVVLFESTPRIVLGSIVATIFAQLWDIYVFERVKRLTGERFLWLRNCVSTFGSQLFDTAIFYSIAFYGTVTDDVLLKLIAGAYLLKLLIAIIDTPVVYLVVRWITGSWTSGGQSGGGTHQVDGVTRA